MATNDTTAQFQVGTEGSPVPGLRLVVESPDEEARLAVVASGHEFRIGRADDLELVLSDAGVSRKHARISFDGVAATVHDLGSANGTFINDKPVQGVMRLQTGDVIRVARARIAVVLVASEAAAGDGTFIAGDGVIASDPASVGMFQLARRLARTDLPVLVQGETGSGKEVVAREIHRASGRAAGAFVALNCATLSEASADIELFGQEPEAPGGARKLGVFEMAHHGTLFLDEVGELSQANQARLLRALQDRSVQRVGGSIHPVDVRVISASNRDLLGEIVARRFRQDLYFRLNGATVMIPPLRARPADIPSMVPRFLAELGRPLALGPGVLATLSSYSWPGNVRELRNALSAAAAVCDGATLEVHHLPRSVRGERAATTPAEPVLDLDAGLRDKVDAMERATIVAALEGCRWNQSRAAQKLGISRRALIYKMERHGLKARPEPR